MTEPFWTKCEHCKKKQKTLAQIGSRKWCIWCGRTFEVKRCARPNYKEMEKIKTAFELNQEMMLR